MYILISISILLALYAIFVARNAHQRLDNSRSFHLTLMRNDKEYRAAIRFYVLYLSGSRIFLDQNEDKKINISHKIDLVLEFEDGKSITCESAGRDTLRLQYITDKNSKLAEQSEEVSIDLLSLLNPANTRKLIEKHLKQMGWQIERAFSGDLFFSKGNLEIYISYI